MKNNNATQLTVTVNAKLDVDAKTAETCLRLVEAFVNAHEEVCVMCEHQDNGEIHFYFDYGEEGADNG